MLPFHHCSIITHWSMTKIYKGDVRRKVKLKGNDPWKFKTQKKYNPEGENLPSVYVVKANQ
jgi:hypothetical protein